MEYNSVKHKIIYYISFGTILVALALLMHFAYLQFAPIEIIKTDGDYQVLNENKTVKSGEQLIYRQKFCKLQSYAGEYRQYFKDGLFYLVSYFTINTPVGCSDKVIYQDVPTTLPIGKYELQTRITYNITPFRIVEVVLQTETFTVIK